MKGNPCKVCPNFKDCRYMNYRDFWKDIIDILEEKPFTNKLSGEKR